MIPIDGHQKLTGCKWLLQQAKIFQRHDRQETGNVAAPIIRRLGNDAATLLRREVPRFALHVLDPLGSRL